MRYIRIWNLFWAGVCTGAFAMRLFGNAPAKESPPIIIFAGLGFLAFGGLCWFGVWTGEQMFGPPDWDRSHGRRRRKKEYAR